MTVGGVSMAGAPKGAASGGMRVDTAPSVGRHGGASWPRVSIVTPSYQQGRFIEETIRSVLEQGYPNLEYIIMDGGSSDGTLDVIRRYEPWLHGWRSGPDGGQSEAINRGWRRATGEVLAWLNSDDRYRPGAIFGAVRALRRHPDADLVYGRSRVVDERGEPTGAVNGRPFRYEELLEGRNPVAQPSAFIRATALERAGPVDESLRYAMDWELWLRLGAQGRVVFVDDVWSDFRLYAESKSGGGSARFQKEIHAVLERALADGTVRLSRAEGRRVLAHSHLRLADREYGALREDPARSHALRAVSLAPGLLTRRPTARRVLRSLAGRKRVRRLLRRP